MISWLDASEHKQFGQQLAAFVIEKLPLAPAGKPQSKRSPREVVRKMVLQVSEFSAKKGGASFYKKAKFGNAFKWRLLEAGYEPDFADELTKELLIHLR
jgi:hypothetical protein